MNNDNIQIMNNTIMSRSLLCFTIDRDIQKCLILIKTLIDQFGRDLNHILIFNFEGIDIKHTFDAIFKENGINYTVVNDGYYSKNFRGKVFKSALRYAKKQNLEYLVFFNEGWPDNINGFLDKINSCDFHSDIYFSARYTNKKNLGHFIDFLSTFLAKNLLGLNVTDTKGDSINVFKVSSLVGEFDLLFPLTDYSWYFWDLLSVAKHNNLKIEMLTEGELETPGSFLKLNLKRFFTIILLATNYLLNKSIYFRKTTSLVDVDFNSPNLKTDESPSESSSAFKEIDKHLSDRVNATKKSTGSNDFRNFPILHPRDIDKNAKIMRIDHFNPKNTETLVVNWCLTTICNFDCSYCPEELHDGAIKGPSMEDFKFVYHKIKESFPDKKIFFEFTGGEVTFYKHFMEIITFIKQNNDYVGIISNGSRKIEFWEKVTPLIDHICLSFHVERCDPDHFYNVVTYLDKHMRTHVNIMMKPEAFDQCYNLAQRITNTSNLTLSLQPLLENMQNEIYGYTEYQKKILETQAIYFTRDPKYKRFPDHEKVTFRGTMLAVLDNETTTYYSSPNLISQGLNRWQGWECYSGVENIIIDQHGTVRRSWCGVGKHIGNIFERVLDLPKTPMICTRKECSCGADIMSTKVRVV